MPELVATLTEDSMSDAQIALIAFVVIVVGLWVIGGVIERVI